MKCLFIDRNSWFDFPYKLLHYTWATFGCLPFDPSRGVLPKYLGGGVLPTPWNPYPISDRNMIFPTLFQTWLTQISIPYFRPARNCSNLHIHLRRALNFRYYSKHISQEKKII